MLFQVFLSSPSATLTLLAELGIQVSCSQHKPQFTLVSWGRWVDGVLDPFHLIMDSSWCCSLCDKGSHYQTRLSEKGPDSELKGLLCA